MTIYRNLQPSETELLKTFIYEAIFVPEGVEPPPFDIIYRPEIALYYNDFGSGDADFCIVAETDGKVVGAVWTRIMDDYGHIDDQTPSFAISILKPYRNQGIGTQLMLKMLQHLNPTLPSLRYFSLYNSKLVICVFMFVYYKLFRF